MRVWPGNAYPLGATWDGSGTNFALFSEIAERVELCLFDSGHPAASAAETRIPLTEVDGFVWHCYLPDVGPGQRYAYRVHGPYDAAARASLQPGQAAARPLRQGRRRPGRAGTSRCTPTGAAIPANINSADSARYMPRNLVISPYFDWAGDRPPRTPYHETLIYEAHVRGLTHAPSRRSRRA